MFQWLSGFLMNPALAIGAGAVASPILIHLLSRRRFRRVRWAAMDFLLEAQRRNRRRIRLEQLILLALRCLAMLLIVLLISRPFLRSGTFGAISQLGRSERIILLDDSFSMGYRSPAGAAEGSVFDRARTAARRIAALAAEASPSDSLTLLTTREPRRPVVAVNGLDEENLRTIGDHLDALQPTESAAHFADCLDAVSAMLRDAATQANQVVYIVSDFQRCDWASVADEEGASGESLLKALAAHSASIRLVLVDVAIDDAPANVAVTGLRPLQSQIVAGVPARFELTIANHSLAALEGVELSIRTASSTLPPIVVPRIGGGATITEPIEVAFPNDGAEFLSVELAGGVRQADGVRVDNVRHAAVRVTPSVRVLIVNGAPADSAYDDEVYLLKTALRPAGRAASGNEVEIIEEPEFESADLGHCDLVILANVNRLTPGAVRRLESFVARGGGLVIFAGGEMDLAFYNEHFHREGAGLLPAAIGRIAETPAGAAPATIANWDASHPVLRAYVDELAAVLRQVEVHAYLALESPDDDGATSGPAPSTRPDAARPPARILARYDDADRSPAIVERKFGDGFCVLITTTADQDWNNWASSFSYLPVMLELVQYAAGPSRAAPMATVGGPLSGFADVVEPVQKAVVRTPSYPADPEMDLAVERADPSYVARYDGTEVAGVYQFQFVAAGGVVAKTFGAVNPDSRESNLARAGQADLKAVMGDTPFEWVGDPEVLAADAAGGRIEIWWPVLLAAIGVLMTEHVLAWWFGTRG
jgi:hypothetical protein